MKRPHDTYFKKMFGDKSIAKDFILHFLKNSALSLLDLDSLELSEDSFVDESLQEHFSDIVYRCKKDSSKEEVFVSILLEHKSYADPNIHLQLLRYMMNTWTRQKSKDSTARLIPVIPIVVYHGKATWEKAPFSSSFQDRGKGFEAFIPQFDYLLSNLNTWSDQAIIKLQAGLIRNVVLALKNSRNPQGLLHNMLHILSLSGEKVHKELPSGFVRTTSLYLFHVSNSNASLIMDTINQIPHQNIEEPYTIAEQFMMQGEARGIEKGEKNIRIDTARKAKAIGLSLAQTIELTGLSKAEIEEIWSKGTP